MAYTYPTFPEDFDRERFFAEHGRDVPLAMRECPEEFSDEDLWEFGYRPASKTLSIAHGAWVTFFYSIRGNLKLLPVAMFARDSSWARTGHKLFRRIQAPIPYDNDAEKREEMRLTISLWKEHLGVRRKYV